ncbi:hypothetical protein ACXN5S_13810 [Pseudoroseicyclus sp. H15]
MTNIDDLATAFLAKRPATRLTGSTRRIVELGIVEPTSDNVSPTIFVYEVRSVEGRTFTTRLSGHPVIFLDNTALEDALHLFDAVHASELENDNTSDILREVALKRLSRSLFVTGHTYEAFAAASMVESGGEVSLSSSKSPLTAFVEPRRRQRFEQRLRSFVISHEAAHTLLETDHHTSARLDERIRKLSQKPGVFFDSASVDTNLAHMVSELPIEPHLAQELALYLKSSEFERFYGVGRRELLADPQFIEEARCDLFAFEASRDGSQSPEASGDIILGSVANFMSRHARFEMDLLDFHAIDAAPRISRTDVETHLAASGSRFSDLDKGRHSTVQGFHVRTMLLSEAVHEAATYTGSAGEITEGPQLETMIPRIVQRMIDMTGGLFSSPDLLPVVLDAADRLRDGLRARNHSDTEVVRELREQYLQMVGLDRTNYS